jgi:hypothetical protein
MGPMSTLSSEVLCVQERPERRGKDTTGSPSARIATGLADVIKTGAGDRRRTGSWAILTFVGVSAFGVVMRTGERLPVSTLKTGLRTSCGPATRERGVNSGAPGFSFDPYEAQVIRNCQRMHIIMILQRNLYLFLVPRRCPDIRGLLHAIFRRVLLLGRGTIRGCYLRGVQVVPVSRISLCNCAWLHGLDKDLSLRYQH